MSGMRGEGVFHFDTFFCADLKVEKGLCNSKSKLCSCGCEVTSPLHLSEELSLCGDTVILNGVKNPVFVEKLNTRFFVPLYWTQNDILLGFFGNFTIQKKYGKLFYCVKNLSVVRPVCGRSVETSGPIPGLIRYT